MYKEILNKIKNNKIKVGVIGLGYVGLPLVERFIKKKINVHGIDNDTKKILNLKNGKSYLPNVKNNSIKYFKKYPDKISSNYSLIKKMDIIIICLPTPLKINKTPDMEILYSCIKNLKKFVTVNQVLILESTVYPGATEELFKKLNYKSKLNLGHNFYLIFSPERENPGDKKFSYKTTPKVVGGSTRKCMEIGYLLYKKIAKKVHMTKSIQVAEMSKLLENSYREVNIGLANEMKLISERMNINIWDVIEAAKTKNFGFSAFNPGPGTGGHCIPIDPMYLVWASKKKNFLPKLIWASSRLNSSMPKVIVNKIYKKMNLLKKGKKKILFIGVAYKKNVGDIRHSPAIDMIHALIKKKHNVSFYDPYVPEIEVYKKKLHSEDFIKKNINKNDIIIITTDHDNINYDKILASKKIIFDTRGVFRNNKKSNKNIYFI